LDVIGLKFNESPCDNLQRVSFLEPVIDRHPDAKNLWHRSIERIDTLQLGICVVEHPKLGVPDRGFVMLTVWRFERQLILPCLAESGYFWQNIPPTSQTISRIHP